MKNGNVETCEEFSDILHDFEAIPESKINMTIFNVAGYTHYENVCSNILAFYLNPNNEHGLGNLVFASLMHLAGGDEILEQNVQVNRELNHKRGAIRHSCGNRQANDWYRKQNIPSFKQ
ncbi:PD-(D/E)XK nuclease family protein [Nitrosomonas sp.]|uniref:PD-(D/E)XK nuclease family protein n=1 Tax=Nitrosomonas sp. TaxID=42353 RepID=UPI0025CCC527|nr:PD-(D/E)XK nuclease family protein [Nitrosomonas sp.]MBV6446505.1 hypothetical protein [Nitrosomonas sp.]